MRALFALALSGCFTTTGCGTLAGGHAYGDDAAFLPGWERIGRAARVAGTDPWTWVPLAGAGILTIDRVDHDIGEWAARETPIFGSNEQAREYSSDARDALRTLSLATTLAASSGDEATTWVPAKIKALLVRELAIGVRSVMTDNLKGTLKRERPDGSDLRSLPSGHTSGAFGYARWVVDDLDSIAIPETAREILRFGTWTTAISVAWARVEGDKHWPIDVLAGAAVGNFATVFVREAFLGLPDPDGPQLYFDIRPDAALLGVHWSF